VAGARELAMECGQWPAGLYRRHLPAGRPAPRASSAVLVAGRPTASVRSRPTATCGWELIYERLKTKGQSR
jgi:hypothetical protein